jgi:polyphenol oxidase
MPETTTPVDNDFVWTETAAGTALMSREFGRVATHVFTTRHLQFHGGPVDADYARLGSCFGVGQGDVVRVKQVHGKRVAIVQPGRDVAPMPDADAIVSTDPSRVVMVRVADCVPVLIADKGRRAVAAVHAGWRGTTAGVCGATVEEIAGLGVPTSDLLVVVGPSIGPCCYQVDAVVRDAFLAAHRRADDWFVPDEAGKWKLDLWQAAVDQLVEAGVLRTNIAVAKLCTADHPQRFFSFRREGGTGRQAAAIRLTRA